MTNLNIHTALQEAIVGVFGKKQKPKENRFEKYEHKPALSKSVQKAIKSIYNALSNEDLLLRCVGGYTQNTNKSVNAKI